jgi:hypothetical protein
MIYCKYFIYLNPVRMSWIKNYKSKYQKKISMTIMF